MILYNIVYKEDKSHQTQTSGRVSLVRGGQAPSARYIFAVFWKKSIKFFFEKVHQRGGEWGDCHISVVFRPGTNAIAEA